MKCGSRACSCVPYLRAECRTCAKLANDFANHESEILSKLDAAEEIATDRADFARVYEDFLKAFSLACDTASWSLANVGQLPPQRLMKSTGRISASRVL